MKILCAPDLHCYWPNYSRTGEDGVPSRLADWRRTANALVEAAVAHRVAAALFPGDFFPNSRPAPAQVLEVASFFRRLENEGISVVGCAGNHDLLGPGQPSPVDVVARMGPQSCRWGFTQPAIAHLPSMEIAVLPSTKAVATKSDTAAAAQDTSEQLIQIARTLIAQTVAGLPAVLMGHWAISGCRLAAGNVLAATEPTLPLGDVQGLPVQAVVMGHIHTPQVIATNPVVLHTGVMERHDFGEEHNECGCWVVDITDQTAEWVPFTARKFYTLNLDISSPSGIDVGAVRDAIARVTYRATEEQAKQVDHGALIRALNDAGAHQVAGVFPEITRSERARETSVTETTRPVEALERWLALRSDLSDDLRGRVLATVGEMLKEVAC